MKLILASGSPRRKQLLCQIGLDHHQVVIPDVDESVTQAMSPYALVELLSRRKAQAVHAQVGDAPIIIAADTVVSLDEQILGKPQDETEAAQMLSALSGKRHQVYTGLTVLQGEKAVTCHEVSSVLFRPLESHEIQSYIATGEPMDKAGAYGIQGIGALFVSAIEGDYFNVMGLPLCRLGGILMDFDLPILTRTSG